MLTSPENVERNRRRLRVLSLRKAGMTLEAIAGIISTEFDLPNYDRRRAHDDVSFELNRLSRESGDNAESLRSLELERLDSYLKAIATQIQAGDIKAIATAVKISERRCKLLGLDAPIQLQIERGIQGELTAVINGLELVMPRHIYEQVLTAIAQLGVNQQSMVLPPSLEFDSD